MHKGTEGTKEVHGHRGTQTHRNIEHKGVHTGTEGTDKRSSGYRGTECMKEQKLQTNSGTEEHWTHRNREHKGVHTGKQKARRSSGYRGTECTKEQKLQTNSGHRGTLDTQETRTRRLENVKSSLVHHSKRGLRKP